MRLSNILGAFIAASIFCISVTASSEPVELAHQYADQALMDFTERLEECAHRRTAVPASAFRNVEATKDQLRLILGYQSARASLECSRAEMSAFLLYSSILQSIAPEVSADLQEGAYVVTHDALTVLRQEAAYRALPEALRLQIEAIPELKVPFDIAETAKELGL